jgi:hypothetical protein
MTAIKISILQAPEMKQPTKLNLENLKLQKMDIFEMFSREIFACPVSGLIVGYLPSSSNWGCQMFSLFDFLNCCHPTKMRQLPTLRCSPGTAFTILYFLRSLQFGQISWGVCSWQVFSVQSNICEDDQVPYSHTIFCVTYNMAK